MTRDNVFPDFMLFKLIWDITGVKKEGNEVIALLKPIVTNVSPEIVAQ